MLKGQRISAATLRTSVWFFLTVSALLALPAQAEVLWHQAERGDNVYYLPQSGPDQILRYDLAAQQWLAPVPLQEVPTAFALDGGHAFVAFGRKIERLSLADGSREHVANTPTDVIALFTDGHLLLVNHSSGIYGRLRSYNRTSFAPIDSFENYIDSLYGSSISRTARRVLGRRQGISPPDITYAAYAEDGQFIGGGDSPYHGSYPGAARTFVFPDGARVVDSSGTVYNTHDLRYSNSFARSVEGIGFHGTDVPIVLSGDSVYAFNNALLPSGQKTLDIEGRALVVHAGRVFVFAAGSSTPEGILVRHFAVEEVGAPEPGQPISPEGLAYPVASVVIGNGVVYLASEAHNAVFRWDVATQRYLQTLVLPEAPSNLAFNEALNRLYAYGPSRRIYRFDLAFAQPEAVPYANLPVPANTLISLQRDLLVASNWSWDAQWIYGETGNLLAERFRCCYIGFHFYDTPRNWLYFDGERAPYLGNGEFGEVEGGSGWGYQPIQISHDGLLTIDSAGVLYRSQDREPVHYLSNNITAAQWLSNGALLTVRVPADWNSPSQLSTTVQRWGGGYALIGDRILPGGHIALLANSAQAVVVSSRQGVPHFTVLDSSLAIAPPAQLDTPALSLEGVAARAVRMGWTSVQGAAGYRVYRRRSGDESWQVLVTLGLAEDTYFDTSVTTGDQWQYRVAAINGGLMSEPSAIIEVDLRPEERVRVDPRGLAFQPADVRLTNEGEVALLSPEHESVFLWDPRRQAWSGSIPLAGAASRMSGPLDSGALVVQYVNGALGSLDTGLSPAEHPFASASAASCGLAATGSTLVACSGNPRSHVPHDLTGGVRPHAIGGQWTIGPSVWRATQRQLIFQEDDYYQRVRRLSVGEDGELHSMFGSYSYPVGDPAILRMDPGGSHLVVGGGIVLSAETLLFAARLDYSINDAAWLGSKLVLLHQDRVTLHAELNPIPQIEVELEFTADRLLALADGGLLVMGSDDQGQPLFQVFDGALSLIEPPVHLSGFEAERSLED